MRAALLMFTGLLTLAAASNESEKKVVCYFGSWAVYRKGNGTFKISDIDPTLCTHMIYSFVGLGADGRVKVLDPWADLADDYAKDGFGNFNRLRKLSPGTKSLVAVGGWNEGGAKYSKMAADPQLRRKFADSVVQFVKKHGFDGFDVDWEYPAKGERGGVPADKANFVALLKELRQRFDKDGLILSAAVGAAKFTASEAYDIAEISKYLHFINVMTYDFHGNWDGKTGINAPLYPGSWEKGNERELNIDASIRYWLKQGAPAEKLILGIPFYGKGFTLPNPQRNGIGEPTNVGSRAGPYTKQAGMLGYNEICEKLIKEKWTVKFEKEQRVPYAYSGDQWVGYDDKRSIKEKADYVKKMGLGGMMVWSVETDDFKGLCGEKYPLLKQINHELHSDVASSQPTPEPPVDQEEEQPEKQTEEQPEEQPVEQRNEQPEEQPEEQPDEQRKEQPEEQTEEQPEEQLEEQTEKQTEDQTQNQSQAKASGVCHQEGYIRDAKECSKFYYCKLVNDQFIDYEFNCQSGLLYDLTISTCNWPDQVVC